MNNYNDIARNIRYILNSTLSELNNPASGLPKLGDRRSVTYTLRSCTDDWMKADLTYWVAMSIADQLQRIAEKAIEEDHIITSVAAEADEDGNIPAVEFNEEWFDEQADIMAKWFTQETVSLVWRGPDSSSNPLSVMESQFKIEAYKKVLEAVTGLGHYSSNMFDFDSIGDIFAGKRKRAAERKELVRKQEDVTPTKIRVTKNGTYMLVAVNKKGEAVATMALQDVTKKGEAVKAAKEWAINLRDEMVAHGKAVGWIVQTGYNSYSPSIAEVV